LTPKLSVDAANLNGAHSASLSNPIDGNLTYLMTASDPAGAVTKVDAPTTGGYNDGYSNAPAGTPQFPNLLTVYAVRPPVARGRRRLCGRHTDWDHSSRLADHLDVGRVDQWQQPKYHREQRHA
jgi:hypothetical protein